MKGAWKSGVLFVLVLVIGCTAPRLTIAPGKAPEVLPLYVRYGTKLDNVTVARFQTAVSQFVSEFNAESHRFKLVECAHDTAPQLKIDVSKTGLVGPGKQATACLVSAFGILATPFIVAKLTDGRYIAAFWYIPRNNTAATLELSDDIAGSVPINRNFRTFPYFGSTESQRIKHAGALKKFIRQAVLEVERSI